MKLSVYSRALKHFSRLAIGVLTLSSISISPSAQAIETSVRIAMVYDLGGLGDGGVNDSAALGTKYVRQKFGLSPFDLREVVTVGSETDRLERLTFLAKAGYNLVIAVGKNWSAAMALAATNYPESQFAIIGGSATDQVNVSVMKFSTKEESFLAGVLAAASSTSKKIGYIAPSSDYESEEGQSAFIAGAKYGNPKVKVSGSILESGASLQVKNMAAGGVDVIYSRWAQNADVYSTILALSKKKKIKMIGNQPDQYFLSSAVAQKILLASVVEDYGLPVKQLVAAALDGQTILDIVDAQRGIYGYLYTSKNGGISLKNYSASSSALTRYSMAKSALSNGRIKL
ncbi:unannotated protein [freshwater metagenome]|uniref:Unannotated protein n=1 Tax=freshwater metagenome TaxID=449393 RepID=A0A6J7PER7_9ZZZZ|nr:BMP family ABC transporter substrate-binding protein [Actinomycetota bacterium]